MMKNLIYLLVTLLTCSAGANEAPVAKPKLDELTQAYQREILFLSTYKREIQTKTSRLNGEFNNKIDAARVELKKLERQWLKAQTDNELLLQKLTDIERDHELKSENKSLIETTIQQAMVSTGQEKLKEASLVTQVESLMSSGVAQLHDAAKIHSKPGSFFLKNGQEQKGEIIFLGNVARFAKSTSGLAALYPSGGGTFKVWQWLDPGQSASLSQNQMPKKLQFFMYDNPEKEFVARKDKTTLEVIQSGGTIAWIIVIMGLLALILSFLRYFMLKRSKVSSPQNLNKAIACLRENDIETAQAHLQKENNSIHRVVSKTLAYLKTEPDKVEDAIVEGILDESRLIDRFGMFILVIASVAPLMGLLGTVTGMISTFDIITLYGTGNPKLLSGGISEALVTTMLGLIVAIPALVVGQYLGSLNESIKSDMEKWALTTCNAFRNRNS